MHSDPINRLKIVHIEIPEFVYKEKDMEMNTLVQVNKSKKNMLKGPETEGAMMPKTPLLRYFFLSNERPSLSPSIEFEDDFSLPEAYSMEECDLTSKTFCLDSSDGNSFFSDSSDNLSRGTINGLFSEDFCQNMFGKYPTAGVEMSFLNFGFLKSIGKTFMKKHNNK